MTQINRIIALQTGLFDKLPAEIIFDIFMAMDIRTLDLSRSVCRYWNRTIIDSPSLQHKIELAISGVGQAPPRTSKTRELSKRTDILRTHRMAWRNLAWHEFRTVPAAPVRFPRSFSEVSLRENVLAQKGTSDSTIYLTRIPSRRLATTEESWTVRDDVGCDYFTMDPSQDLLVLMETSNNSAGCHAAGLAVYLRSLTTGAVHPLAHDNVFHVSFHALTLRQLRCEGQVVDDYLGVLYSDDRDTGFEKPIVVWNWKTGDKILEIVSDRIFSFSFIDEIHILVALSDSFMDDGPCAAVSVYDLTNPTSVSSRTHVTKATNRCTFLLPESDWVDSIYVRCSPSSLRQSVLAYSSSEDLPDSVVTICAYCHADTHSTETAVKIFVPASRLRDRILAATPGQRLAWHEWGLTDAHVEVDAGSYFAEARFDSVAGMRAVDLSDDFTRLCVYDFEPSRISRYFHRTDPEVLENSKDHAARDAALVALPSIEPLDWNARALKMFVPASDWDESGSASLSVLKTSIELPEQLCGLDFDIWNTLVTDDAIVILNPAHLGLVHILRF